MTSTPDTPGTNLASNGEREPNGQAAIDEAAELAEIAPGEDEDPHEQTDSD